MPSVLSTHTPVSPLSSNVSPQPQTVEVAQAGNFGQNPPIHEVQNGNPQLQRPHPGYFGQGNVNPGPQYQGVQNVHPQLQQPQQGYFAQGNINQGPPVSELHGSSVMFPPGAGLPPDRR